MAVDRARELTCHPQHGSWTDQLDDLVKGRTLTSRRWLLLEKMVDSEREEYERSNGSVARSKMGIDVNMMKLRPDHP